MMTIVGILGCTMLIVLGFGLRDTVGGLMLDQYDTVTVYDAIVVTDNLNSDEMKTLTNEWTSEGNVKDALPLQISSMTLRSQSNHTEITVMVIPDDADLNTYVHLQDSVTQKAMTLPSNGIVVTKSAAKQISLVKGDTASLLNENNIQHDFSVDFISANYVGNYVFISESCYQATFGDYAGSTFLLNLADKTDGQKWLTLLKDDDKILTVSSSQSAIDSFNAINLDMVIYLLIGMSAVLALAVLFTLSNINISERERELATIKVLGFQRKEVYSYVNKETVILSLIGILCGLPAGYAITYGILGNLSIADISFHVRVSPIAYLISAVLTLTFTLLVNKITNKGLRKINMVEALKSVE
jgi:putative ABC transport system permease protein